MRALALLAGLVPALALGAPAPRLSTHAAALAAHAGESLPPRPSPGPVATRALRPGAVVYGYLPYWITDTASLRLDLLSHVGWFSVELGSTGSATDAHGWPDTAFVTAAHAAGVKVELAFTLFSASGIATLVNSPANRATAIQTMVTRMAAGSADGVALDLEGVPASARDGFTALVCELRAALTAAGHPAASISIAGPAVDWSDAFDLPALLGCADTFFIMGYDFYGGWSGSGVGPSGILHVTPLWRPTTSHSEQTAMATWTSMVGAELREKIVLGVPYYGNQWQTGSAQPGASNLGHDGSVLYRAARQKLAPGTITRLWEDGSKTPWYTFLLAGVQRQVWYDDEESLHHKYVMAKEQGLGGVGMWALGYDHGYTELWDLLQADFGAPDPVVAGTREQPLPITSLPFHDARDTRDPASAPSNWFNYYSCAPTIAEYGREVVYRVDLCQPGTLTATLTGDDATTDIDIHLLDGLTEADCLARSNTEVSQALTPGAYYLVADTYVANAIEQAGPFTLDVTFAPSGGAACGAGETCVAGTCVAPQQDAGVPDDAAPGDDGPPAADAAAEDAAAADAGADAPTTVYRAADCGCAAAPAAPAGALLFVGAALLGWRYRRRRGR
ncbi:MAG TPA: glycosyl hydrolase family 18 protein [Polyangia bacterium]|jgi:spore germination protein YaaH